MYITKLADIRFYTKNNQLQSIKDSPMQKSNMLIGSGILLLLFSIGYLYFESSQSSNPSFASIMPLIEQIMVVDINKTGVFTEEAVLKGRLPILAINSSE